VESPSPSPSSGLNQVACYAAASDCGAVASYGAWTTRVPPCPDRELERRHLVGWLT